MNDAINWLCKTCTSDGVAYEFNLDAIPRDIDMANVEDDSRAAHLKAMVNAMNDHCTKVSIGSDAHKLDTIGDIDPHLIILKKFGLKPNLLIDDSFFE